MKDLGKRCSSAASSDTDTCIVILKGSKYTSAHVAVEENLVKQFPKMKIVSIDAVKYRLSFEDTEKSRADSFSMKLHAIRKGGYFLSMHDPPSWENVEAFASRAMSTDLDQYDGHGDIQLVAAPSKGFKKRAAAMPPPPSARPSTTESTGAPSQASSAPKMDTKDNSGPSEAEVEAARLARERRRREEMERQQREALFEEGDASDDYGDEERDEEHEDDQSGAYDDEDIEDELIEL
jgi:hypothetical protein